MVGVALVAEEYIEVGIEVQEGQSTEGCMAVGKIPRVARHALGEMTRIPYLVDRHMWPVGGRTGNRSTKYCVSLEGYKSLNDLRMRQGSVPWGFAPCFPLACCHHCYHLQLVLPSSPYVLPAAFLNRKAIRI
jgi:hypothetical protein